MLGRFPELKLLNIEENKLFIECLSDAAISKKLLSEPKISQELSNKQLYYLIQHHESLAIAIATDLTFSHIISRLSDIEIKKLCLKYEFFTSYLLENQLDRNEVRINIPNYQSGIEQNCKNIPDYQKEKELELEELEEAFIKATINESNEELKKQLYQKEIDKIQAFYLEVEEERKEAERIYKDTVNYITYIDGYELSDNHEYMENINHEEHEVDDDIENNLDNNLNNKSLEHDHIEENNITTDISINKIPSAPSVKLLINSQQQSGLLKSDIDRITANENVTDHSLQKVKLN